MNKSKANEDIREAIYKSGLRYWEIAERCGFSPSVFSVKLRRELSGNEKYKLFCIIQEMVDEKGGKA